MSILRTAITAAVLLTPALASAQSSVVTVNNSSSWNIEYLYLSPTAQSTWGADQLGNTILSSGSAHTFMGIGCNNYDVRLVDEDGDECVVSGVSLCGEQATWQITNNDLLSCQAQTAAQAAPSPSVSTYTPPSSSSVQMMNQSQIVVHELYVSPSGSQAWGPDQLGSSVITPGSSFTLSGIACGSYDVMMTDPNGGRCVLSQIPLCAGAEQWVLTDYNLSNCAY